LVVVGWQLADPPGKTLKKLTSTFFAPPKIARKAEARLQRAKLAVIAARKRAARTARRYAAHRLAETLCAKS
jgi:hypothetical protein